MKNLKIYILQLFLITGCTAARSPQIRYPQPTYLQPDNDNPHLGSDYKNQRWLLDNEGIPKEPTNYFNYEDFEAWFPIGNLVVFPPYDKENDLNKVPNNKLKTYYEKKIDSSLVKEFSKKLFEVKEPALNNFYLGKEMYRFIWSRSFHDDFVVRIWAEDNKSSIETIRIQKRNNQTTKTTKKISIEEFRDFKKLLLQSKFWILPTYEWDLGNDGSYWWIEAHTNRKYHALCRWSPDLLYEDNLALRQLGQWMIDKSGIKGEEIY